jgi:hypothetical protein
MATLLNQETRGVHQLPVKKNDTGYTQSFSDIFFPLLQMAVRVGTGRKIAAQGGYGGGESFRNAPLMESAIELASDSGISTAGGGPNPFKSKSLQKQSVTKIASVLPLLQL